MSSEVGSLEIEVIIFQVSLQVAHWNQQHIILATFSNVQQACTDMLFYLKGIMGQNSLGCEGIHQDPLRLVLLSFAKF